MVNNLVEWFESKSFQVQIIVLALVFDPLGFVGGYLLGPAVGLEPLMGAVIGVVVASFPTTIHVVREASRNGQASS